MAFLSSERSHETRPSIINFASSLSLYVILNNEVYRRIPETFQRSFPRQEES